jgi:hypothetical protein
MGGEIVTGLTNVRLAGGAVARDVNLDALTTGAASVVGVRVCLVGAVMPPVPPIILTVVAFFAGLSVVVFVIVEVF